MTKVIAGRKGDLAYSTARSIIKRGWARALGILRGGRERKRGEEALRESEERFRVSLMNSPIVVFSQDSELRYTWIHNPVPGFSVEDILRKTDEDLLPPEEASRLTAIKQRVLDSGVGTREEIQATAHGEVIFHDLTVEPLRDATGTIVGITGASMDITERKRAEETLRESEERFRDLYDDAPIAYLSVGIDARIRRANRGAMELLGYPMDELVGRPVFDLYADAPTGKAKAQEVFRRFLAGEEIRGEELEMRRADGGQVWISLSVRPTRDAQGRIVETRSVVVDLTERKRAEEALQKAREELEGKVEHQLLRPNPYSLTFRELTVLHKVAAGESDRQVGITLGISHLTAQKHVSNILAKMEAASRTEAAARALREGLLD